MTPPMTLEQQRDYLKRLQGGWTAASVTQIEGLTESEKSRMIRELVGLLELKNDSFLIRLKEFQQEHGLK
jgi:hypothetical protein